MTDNIIYILKHFSGYTTIREIYEDMETSWNIYTSIDNVLSRKYNTSFIEAYIDFRVCNYDIQSNYNFNEDYDLVLTGVQNSPKKTAISEDIVSYTTPKLSTMYFEFEAETEDYYTFCFALEGETEASEVNLTGIYTSPDGEVTIINYPFTSSLKMPNVDMEEGSTICFLMSNVNTAYGDTDIQFNVCM